LTNNGEGGMHEVKWKEIVKRRELTRTT